MDETKLEKLLAQFADWLLQHGHAEDQHEAQTLASNFVTAEWAEDDDYSLSGWVAAYNHVIEQQ